MKLVTATDVWYTQQQKTLDEIADKLGVVAYRPNYHGAEGDKNTVLFYLKEDEAHNRKVDRQPVRYSRSEAKDRGLDVNSECVYESCEKFVTKTALFTGVFVGVTWLCTELFCEWNDPPYGRSGFQCSSINPKPFAIVYYAENKKRLVPMDSIEKVER